MLKRSAFFIRAMSAKPPNILVVNGNAENEDDVKCVQSHLPKNRFLVYPLLSASSSNGWRENALALIVSGRPQQENDLKAIEKFIEDEDRSVPVAQFLDDGRFFGQHPQVIERGDFEIEPLNAFCRFPLNQDQEKAKIVLRRILKVPDEENERDDLDLTPATLVSQDEDAFCAAVENMPNLAFGIANKVDETISSEFLPVTTSTSSRTFDKKVYFSRLKTASLGHVLLHSEVMNSSFEPLKRGSPLNGLVVVPDIQLGGRGRGRNGWISPKGAAMFTLHFETSRDSLLGQKASMLCHLVALAVVRACDNGDVRIKWPNDVYWKRESKLGGILIQSAFKGRVVEFDIGVGFNLDNEEPLKGLNLYQETVLKREVFLAEVFNHLERILQEYEEDETSVRSEYKEHWLHQDQPVEVVGLGEAVVQDIDDYGFLVVKRVQDGSIKSVQPDGNSFDMMKGLIAPK